jgi:DNA-binding NtrC family response regulator
MKVPAKRLSRDAVEKLTGYAFPGNIRELANLLERALILGHQAELQPEDFPLQPSVVPNGPLHQKPTVEQLAAQLPEQLDLRDVLARLERSLIARAITSSGGVQAEAARQLGLSRSDLGYKVNKYSI